MAFLDDFIYFKIKSEPVSKNTIVYLSQDTYDSKILPLFSSPKSQYIESKLKTGLW